MRGRRGDAVEAYLGPFVVDHGHPAMQGVSLVGVVWAASAAGGGEPAGGGGRPVVSAGDAVLLSDRERADGSHELTWRLRPERSTLLNAAAMPVMVWNLIDWRRSERPGLSPVNVRPGVPVTVRTAEPRGEVTVRRLGGAGETQVEGQTLAVSDRRAVVVPQRPGVYDVTVAGPAGDEAVSYRFAVHAAAPAESDLTALAAGATGEWNDQASIEREYRGLAWALGLLALAVLGLHGWLVHREAGLGAGGGLPGETGGGI